jgi:hypothetical protein
MEKGAGATTSKNYASQDMPIAGASVHLLKVKRIQFSVGVRSLNVPPNFSVLKSDQIHILLYPIHSSRTAAFESQGFKGA